MSLLTRMLLAASTALTLALPLSSHADSFPNKPVVLVSPFAPGGGNDIVSRILAEGLGKLWGHTVVVENRSGAGGNLGAAHVAKAAADGHTLLMGSLSYPINASLYTSLPFDPTKDLTPVSMIAFGSYVLAVHPSTPARSLAELVALAKAKPGELSYSSAGSGSGGHLGTEMFKVAAGIDLLHVPFRGTAPALNAAVAGHVAVVMDNVLALAPQIKAGKLRPLAVTSLTRTPLFPDVPTMDESGYPKFEVSPWFGLFTTAGTPKAVIDKISADSAKVLGEPEVAKRIREQGAEPVGNTPQAFSSYVASEMAKWRKVVKTTGARVE